MQLRQTAQHKARERAERANEPNEVGPPSLTACTRFVDCVGLFEYSPLFEYFIPIKYRNFRKNERTTIWSGKSSLA